MNAKPCILWQNRLLDGTITVSSELGGWPKENLLNWRQEYQWQGDGSGDQWVMLDALGDVDVDCFAIMLHDFFTQGVQGLVLQHSANGTDWTNCHTPVNPTDDLALAVFFETVTDRYFRLLIPAGYTLPPFLGLLFIGEKMEFPGWCSAPFSPDRRTRRAETVRTRGGLPLGGSVQYRERKLALKFRSVSLTWLEANWKVLFDTHDDPFFLVWDLTNHPRSVWLVQLPDNADYDPSYKGTMCDLDVDLVGVEES